MKQLSKVLAIALMVACAVAFMPLLNGQAFAASKGPKIKSAKYTVKTQKVTVKWAKNKKAKSYQVKVGSKKAKTVKKSKKSYSVKYAQKAKAQTIKVKVRAKVGKKWTKWSTKKVKIAAKKAPTPTPEVVAITGVAIDNAAPKVGDTLTAKVEPANASNVTYQWNVGGTAVEGATAATYTVVAADLGKVISVTVKGDNESTATSADTAAVAAVPGTLAAVQTGANTIEVTYGEEIAAGDVIALKKGSTAQTATVVKDGSKATITTSSTLSDGEYTVTLTPADTAKAAVEAKVTCATAKLTTLEFGKELVLASNTEFYEASALLTGKDQFGGVVNLGSNVKVYASTATNGDPVYDAKTNTVTIAKATSQLPFTLGDQITLTAIYQSGTTVVQQAATLTVSNAAYVATMEFGELATTSTKLKDKRVTFTNFNKGTYYIPVTAADQYGNELDSDELNDAVNNTLFVNPKAENAVYGGFVEFDELDDGTVVMFVDDAQMPGEGTIQVAGLGGLSASATFKVEDDPYIDTMNVTFESDLYQDTESEMTVTAVDQYGDAYDLYEDLEEMSSNGTKISFGDLNNTINQGSSISVTNGTLEFKGKSATKTVEFTYTPNKEATTDVAQISTAKPNVTTQTLTIKAIGTPAAISKTLGVATTIDAGQSVDFGKGLTFTDTNGKVVDGDVVKLPTFSEEKVELPKADGFYYTISHVDSNGKTEYDPKKVEPTDDTPEKYLPIVTPENNTTYTVELIQVDNDAETETKKVQVLDSKEFKITVAGTYEDYEASIAQGDELLANWKTSGDSATIVVKGTDENGNTATVDPKNYSLTVNKGLTVNSDTKTIEPADDTSEASSESGATSGVATVTVWTKAGKEVATVSLNYSNAPSVAKEWSWLKDKGQATEKVADDVIDVNNAANASEANGVLTIAGSYTLEAVDQYGLTFKGTVFNMNGEKFEGSKFKADQVPAEEGWERTAPKTFTIKADAGDLDTKTVKVVMAKGAWKKVDTVTP